MAGWIGVHNLSAMPIPGMGELNAIIAHTLFRWNYVKYVWFTFISSISRYNPNKVLCYGLIGDVFSKESTSANVDLPTFIFISFFYAYLRPDALLFSVLFGYIWEIWSAFGFSWAVFWGEDYFLGTVLIGGCWVVC